jgi:hypothetical protein
MTRVQLVARAGGRCEFDGCNEFLFEHPLTLRAGNFAELAHVVAFSEDGPRGRHATRPADIHAIDNLMLLCRRDHTEIDSRPGDHSVEALRRQKADHEARIRFLTDMRPNRRTAVLQFKSKVRGQMVDIPNADIATAVAPMYPMSKLGYLVDLTEIDAEGAAFVQTAKACIDKKLALYYVQGSEVDQALHVSLFAIGPIPLLVYMGSRMSDKIRVELFQRHRDPDGWAWRESGEVTRFATTQIRTGDAPENVALVLSVSGRIAPSALPASVDGTFALYEIAPEGREPGTDVLARRESLEAFRAEYRRFLARVVREHPQCREVQVFPAVPAPAAVATGLDRLRHVQPRLAIFNNEGLEQGFVKTLTIDDHDTY